MKKSKLSVSSLAVKNIKSHKKQYFTMIVGLVLAMIFSSSILFFASCLGASIKEATNRRIGSQDVIINDAQYINFEDEYYKDNIKKIGFAHILGFAYTDKGTEKNGTVISWLDEKALDLSNPVLNEGRLPKNVGEIAIEQDALLRMKSEKKLGDNITLKIKAADSDNYLEEEIEKTFKIVGILYDKRKHIEKGQDFENVSFDYPTIISSNYERLPQGKERVMAFLTLKKRNVDNDFFFSEHVSDDLAKFGLIDRGTYSDTLKYINLRSDDIGYMANSFEDMAIHTAIVSILAFILVIASCIGIVNAVNSNLNCRKNQIGLYRSIGATKLQIIKIFGRETFYISMITVPISILLSYYFTKFVINLMGSEFVFLPQWHTLLISAVVSLICVWIASFVPLCSASRISPMQAVRDISRTYKMNRKKIKSKKVYKVPSLVARRSMDFSKGKQVCISLLLAFILLLSGFGFSTISAVNDRLKASNVKNDYQVLSLGGPIATSAYNAPGNYYMTSAITQEAVNDILLLPHVKSVKGNKSYNANLVLNRPLTDYELIDIRDTYSQSNINIYNYKDVFSSFDSLRKYLNSNIDKEYIDFKDKVYDGNYFISHSLESLDDSDIKNLEKSVIDGKIDIDKLNSGEEIIMNVTPKQAFDITVSRTPSGDYLSIDSADLNEKHDSQNIFLEAECPYKAGDTITISVLKTDENTEESFKDDYMHPYYIPNDLRGITKEVKIGALVYNKQISGMITTHQGLEKFYPTAPYLNLYIDMDSDCTDEIDEIMVPYLEQFKSGNSIMVQSAYSQNKENEKLINACYLATACVVILFFTIAASMINNSISSQIIESKREIGTLRSVGASKREITQIYLRELSSMFAWGLGTGALLYLISFYIFKKVIEHFNFDVSLNLSVMPAIIICAALLIICTANVFIKVKQQMKNSIVENIREL